MFDFPCSVVITTYNRSSLLGRAIQSALDQAWPNLEVIVVDDASTDGTTELMRSSFPHVRYVRQESNRGVCAARNRGLREASQPWVLFLDDDDTFLPGALELIAARIAGLPDRELYPVFQFPRGNGRVAAPFMIVRMEDNITGNVQGDFAAVIRREYFLTEGLVYPEFHSSAESLLWWKVADKYGIPTWSDQVQTLFDDAPSRMMSTQFQVRHARDHAELDEAILSEYADVLAARFPRHYHRRRLGAATYRLLAEEPAKARSHVLLALQQRLSAEALGLWFLTFLPRRWVLRCYAFYKRRANGWKS